MKIDQISRGKNVQKKAFRSLKLAVLRIEL